MPRLKQGTLRGSVTQNMIARPKRGKPDQLSGLMLRLGALLGSLVLLIGLGIWLWHIHWPQKQAERLYNAALHTTQKADFAVRDVIIEGRQQTDRDELTAALNISAGAPILDFDPSEAHERVVHLPWVAEAIVQRRLPDTIYVKLTERVPIARWQHDNRTVIIDRDGKELPNARLDNFAPLPLVVGNDAPQETLALLTLLRTYPTVLRPMTAAVRVSERRWDLHLQPNLVVKLPEQNASTAVQKLARLIREQQVLERNISTIDLRLPDRMVLESGSPPANPHDAGAAKQ